MDERGEVEEHSSAQFKLGLCDAHHDAMLSGLERQV